MVCVTETAADRLETDKDRGSPKGLSSVAASPVFPLTAAPGGRAGTQIQPLTALAPESPTCLLVILEESGPQGVGMVRTPQKGTGGSWDIVLSPETMGSVGGWGTERVYLKDEEGSLWD